MYSRWYEVAVVLLWLSTMSWLVTQKVMPAFMVGDPPSTDLILEARQPDVPVYWSMALNHQPLGWATSETLPQPDASTKIRGRVHFDRLPLTEMIPKQFKILLGSLGPLEDQFGMETLSVVIFTPDGQLKHFESTVRDESGKNLIEVRGDIEGAMLALSVRCDEFVYETERVLPPKAVLSDGLSPEDRLPGLELGQTWAVKLYSPLRPPNNPIEILQAKVEGVHPMAWDGRPVDALLVAYRPDRGSILGGSNKPRARLWVHPDGTVLKQESTIFDTTMTFLRLPEAEAAELAKTIPEI